MFKNVIVGVDGRSGGRDAAALASRLMDPSGQLTLVYVHLETTAVIVHEFDSSARKKTQGLLERERDGLDVKAAIATVGGASVASGLHTYAQEHAADLLVLGTCRRGLVGRVLAGDDTRASLECSPCAVAVAPQGYASDPAPIAIIGVRFDGSAESEQALARARELGADGAASVEALIVVAAVRFGGVLAPMNGVMRTDPRLEIMRCQLKELQGVEVRPAFGVPVEELRSFSGEVDLLVLGSRSDAPTARLEADRASKSLARSPACPLLVLPSLKATPESTDCGAVERMPTAIASGSR